ncbi:hypothetical protein STEG23_037635 [Scotinomys teguina]
MESHGRLSGIGPPCRHQTCTNPPNGSPTCRIRFSRTPRAWHGNWTGEFDNLMDQLRVAIVTVNSTWVNAGLAEGLSSWISAEMNHLKEWVILYPSVVFDAVED